MGDRLAQLHAELAAGRQALLQLDSRRDQMVASLLRLEGAVQVLEELLAAAAPDVRPAGPPDVRVPAPDVRAAGADRLDEPASDPLARTPA